MPDRTDDNPYSNAVLVGDTLYLAGDIGIDPDTDAPPPKIEDEVRLVMESMKTRLEMVGMSMDDLVMVEVHCPDLSLYDQFNDVYRTYFNDHFPARAFLGSGPLLSGWALRGDGRRRAAVDAPLRGGTCPMCALLARRDPGAGGSGSGGYGIFIVMGSRSGSTVTLPPGARASRVTA